MTGGFEANVPARKPRTRIGRVLAELTSDMEERALEGVDETSSTVREPVNGSEGASTPSSGRHREPTPEAPPRTEAEPGRPGPDVAQDTPHLEAGRARIASLRERLTQAERAPIAVDEPKRAAAAVLEAVQDLRARLDAAVRERSEAVGALDEARAELARARADAEKERKLRSAVEAQAEERARIAQEAVMEAEALAAERDQVLSELAEQRRLDDEQAALLAEAEKLLTRRDEERARAAGDAAALRDEIDARAVQLAEMESRLRAGAADHARVEARCRELEARVAELTEAQEALEALEATVNRRSR